MADKKYTFEVDINEQTARSKARTLRATFEQELGQIKIDNIQLNNSGGLKQLEAAIQAQAKAFQASVQTTARSSAAADQQTTAVAKAAAAERINASRAESAERIAAARAASAAAIEEERRLTATTRAEIRERETANRSQRTPTGGAIGGDSSGAGIGTALLSAAKTTAAAYLTVQGLQKIAQAAVGIARADTAIRRTNAAFVILAGGAQAAEGRMLALQRASNGTIDRLNAMNLANTVAALKLAKTSEEFLNLGRAARVITLVSPVIRDVNDALTQLALFSANPASFARADQLGLSAAQVRERMAELRAENSALSAEDAKLAASLQLLQENFGSLLDSTEAQASGLERLNVAWGDFYNQQSGFGKFVDNRIGDLAGLLNQLASVSGFGQSSAILDAARTNLEAAQNQVGLAKSFLGIFGSKGAETSAAIFEQTYLALQKTNTAIENGVPTALEYRGQIEAIVLEQSRFGVATTDQAERLLAINQGLAVATASWQRYSEAQNAATAAQAQQGQAKQFADSISSIDTAITSLSSGTAAGLPAVSSWVDELVSLREELATTGTVTDDQRYRLDELTAAAQSNVDSTSILAAAQERFGAAMVQNNDRVSAIAGDITNLNAAFVAGKISQEAYTASMARLEGALNAAANAAQGQFNAALAQSLTALQALDILTGSGFAGLDNLRQQLIDARTEIINTGAATTEQIDHIGALSAAVDAAGNSQIHYADIIGGLGTAFLEVNDRAATIVGQINSMEGAFAAGTIGAEQYAQSIFQLRQELAGIATGVDVGSTQSLGDLAGAILTLDQVTAGGLPGFDTLLDQAFELESQISATGIVTAQQASDIEYLALVADTAASSTGIYAQIQNALGAEFLASNEQASGLVQQILLLVSAHANGTLSSEVFAGALSILTGQLVSTGSQAGLTAAQINAAFGALQQFNAEQSAAFAGTPGFGRGQNLAASITAAEQAKENSRKRAEAQKAANEAQRLQEQAARKAEQAFDKAAKETQQAFEKAAQALEGELKAVPGLFGRSQVTQQQLDLAKGGIPQNFADDFLRRLQAEIEQGKDLFPDVSVDKAREALGRVGIQAADDAKVMFQQLVDAWESGVLFSNKENLDLINGEAVKAAVELQRLAKQGQQNILDHFKNVIGIAVDAATGETVAAGGAGGVTLPGGTTIPQQIDISLPGDKPIPDTIAVEAPTDLVTQLGTGTATITSVLVDPTAFAALDAALAERVSTLTIDSVTITPGIFSAVDTFLSERVFTLTLSRVLVDAGVFSSIDTLFTERTTALVLNALSIDPAIFGTIDTALTERISTLQVQRVAIDPTIYSTIDTALTEHIFSMTVARAEIAPGTLAMIDTFLSERVFTLTLSRVAIDPVVYSTIDTTFTERITSLVLNQATIDPAVFTTIDTALTERINTLPIQRATIDPAVYATIDTALTERLTSMVINQAKIGEGAYTTLDTLLSERIFSLQIGGIALAHELFTPVDTFLTERLFTLSIGRVDLSPTALSGLQASLNAEALAGPAQAGLSLARVVEIGFASYSFPNVGLSFVAALAAQSEEQRSALAGHGYSYAALVDEGFRSFDFSLSLAGLVRGLRSGIQQDEVRAALIGVGAEAAHILRDGLSSEAADISWAGILVDAIRISVVEEFAAGLAES